MLLRFESMILFVLHFWSHKLWLCFFFALLVAILKDIKRNCWSSSAASKNVPDKCTPSATTQKQQRYNIRQIAVRKLPLSIPFVTVIFVMHAHAPKKLGTVGSICSTAKARHGAFNFQGAACILRKQLRRCVFGRNAEIKKYWRLGSYQTIRRFWWRQWCGKVGASYFASISYSCCPVDEKLITISPPELTLRVCMYVCVHRVLQRRRRFGWWQRRCRMKKIAHGFIICRISFKMCACARSLRQL